MKKRKKACATKTKKRAGFIHVISPATASKIRRTLKIPAARRRNILRIFKEVGIKL